MKNEERIAKLKNNDYQKYFGVKKPTFEKMLEILKETYRKEHLCGGRPLKISLLDKLVIMLAYYREYRTMDSIAFDYGVSKSTISQSIHWVEQALILSGEFRLPSKRELASNVELEIVLVDATECEIERPQKNKSNTIPGRKRNIP